MIIFRSLFESSVTGRKSKRERYARTSGGALAAITYTIIMTGSAGAQTTTECDNLMKRSKWYIEDAAFFYNENIRFSAGDESKVIELTRRFYLGTYNIPDRNIEAQAKSIVIQSALNLSLKPRLAPDFEGGVDRICEDAVRLKAPLLAESCVHGRIHVGRFFDVFGGVPDSVEVMEALFKFSADDPSLLVLKDGGRTKEQGEKIYSERISGIIQTIKLMHACGNSLTFEPRKR